jgi:spore germination protein GerM
MRLLYMFKLEEQGDNQDSSYEMAWMGLWSWAEIALGIIVACTLTLPKLVRAKSKEFSVLLSSVARPFTSFRSSSKTNLTKIRSNDTAKVKVSLQELNAKAPRVREYVHAPPGLTLDSDGGSFIIRNSNGDYV